MNLTQWDTALNFAKKQAMLDNRDAQSVGDIMRNLQQLYGMDVDTSRKVATWAMVGGDRPTYA